MIIIIIIIIIILINFCILFYFMLWLWYGIIYSNNFKYSQPLMFPAYVSSRNVQKTAIKTMIINGTY